MRRTLFTSVRNLHGRPFVPPISLSRDLVQEQLCNDKGLVRGDLDFGEPERSEAALKSFLQEPPHSGDEPQSNHFANRKY